VVSWWEAWGSWWEASAQWRIWDFRKGLAIELQGFKKLRGLVGDPLLVRGLGPGAPRALPKSGPDAS